MIFFNLPALMDDDNEGKDGILCVLFVGIFQTLQTLCWYSATVPPSGRGRVDLVVLSQCIRSIPHW